MDTLAAIRESVTRVLPHLSSSLLDSVINKLNDLGVETTEDLSFVVTEDLESLLKPIQIRKLIKSWKTVVCTEEKATVTKEYDVPVPVEIVPHVDYNTINSGMRWEANGVTKTVLFCSEDNTESSSSAVRANDTSERTDNSADAPGRTVSPVASSSYSQPDTPSSTSPQNPAPIQTSPTLPDNWAEKYVIKWKYFPQDIRSVLERGGRLVPSFRRRLVRMVCDDIMQITTRPGKKNLERIVARMVGTYPESLQDKQDDGIFGNGYESLLRQFRMRVDNQNKYPDTPLGKRGKESLSPGDMHEDLMDEVAEEQTKEEDAFVREYISTEETAVLDLLHPAYMPPHNWADQFVIPWHLVPNDITEGLQSCKRLDPSLRRQLVRILCQEIMKVQRKPGIKNIERIAARVVETYPESLQDRIGKTIVGFGYDSLLKQMRGRCENQNRTKNIHSPKVPRCRVSVSDEEDLSDQSSVSDSYIRDCYGCVNWLPQSLPPRETPETQTSHQSWLKQHYTMPRESWDQTNIDKFMRLTYATQRQAILGVRLTTVELKEEWPFLFEPKWFLDHFEMLVGVNLALVMTSSMRQKAGKLYEFMQSIPQVGPAVQYIQHNSTVGNSDLPQTVGSLLLLCQYFGENQDVLFFNVEEGTSVAEIEGQEKLPNTPCIVVLGRGLLQASNFLLIVDRHVLIEDISSPLSAVHLLFAAYYVLNIAYPVEAGATLEFIQRCFVKINPGLGSKIEKRKGKKFRTGAHPGVLALVNDLALFHSSMEH